MTRARIWISLAGVAGCVTAAIALGAIWLILSRPVAVAEAVQDGSVTPMVKALGAALVDAWWALARWL